MDNLESEEPDKKKPHLNHSSMARSSDSLLAPDNKPVSASVLQYQNQMLLQQLDRQKQELHDLEVKLQELNDSQSSFDNMLIEVNELWNQIVDDLALLGVRAGAGQDALQILDAGDFSQGSIASSPVENVFLTRLLNGDTCEGNIGDDCVRSVKEVLAQHHSSTWDLLMDVEHIIEDQIIKVTSTSQELHHNLSTEDAIILLNKIETMMAEESNYLHVMIDAIHQKQQLYADRIQSYIQNQSVDEPEIKRLAADLEESMAELEESRRKLVNLTMQKNVASQAYNPASGIVNGNLSLEKQSDRTMNLQELKNSIGEAEILANDRLAELEEARKDNVKLKKHLENVENEMKDEKYVCSSRAYTSLNDQLSHWKDELLRYRSLTDPLQAERSYLVRREKELDSKMESTDTAKAAIANAEKRIEELELQILKACIEKNEIEVTLEEAVQDSGRKDIKDEFNVMSSALSKEMGMVEAQVNRWKDIAQEALSSREEAESHRAVLSGKTSEVEVLVDKCAQQMVNIKSLKELVEKLNKEKFEQEIYVDMLGQGIYDNRDLLEIQESERIACMQAEVLKQALDEHNLELRLKAANEAEAACQQRLLVAEAEIADLWIKVDATERDVCELSEAINIKDAEAEAYVSEIETIGQAYEDMQTQNQHLLQQMTERDDYNLKVVSKSVKTKQAVNALLSEKQVLTKQFEQVNGSLESLKVGISKSEEKIKSIMLEALNSCQEDRHLLVSLEMAKWELADSEKELKWLKSAMASSEKDYEQIQRKTAEVQEELDCERNEKEKIMEQLNEWNDKVAELITETGEAAIQRLQEETKECKDILRCGVCGDRPKEVVIVKCYHLFCNRCIQKNLEIRHRKCPRCGIAFGQSDVRFVKI